MSLTRKGSSTKGRSPSLSSRLWWRRKIPEQITKNPQKQVTRVASEEERVVDCYMSLWVFTLSFFFLTHHWSYCNKRNNKFKVVNGFELVKETVSMPCHQNTNGFNPTNIGLILTYEYTVLQNIEQKDASTKKKQHVLFIRPKSCTLFDHPWKRRADAIMVEVVNNT